MYGNHPIEEYFHQQIAPYLKDKDFIFVPAFQQYRHLTSIGFQCVIFSFSHYPDTSILEVHLGIRADEVEQLAFSFTNGLPGFRSDSLTLVTPIAKLLEKSFERFEIKDEASCSEAIQEIQKQLDQYGWTFLNQHSRLERLNKLFNESPNQALPLIHNQINRCIRGITLAKLTHADRFKELGITYRNALQSSTVLSIHQQKYERLYQFLLSYSMN